MDAMQKPCWKNWTCSTANRGITGQPSALSNQLMSMKLKLSCADFSFPLLSHDTALKVIALLGLRGVDIGLFANRSRLRPEVELRNPEKNGANLYRRLECMGLFAADIFLQLHENFTDFAAVNHPDAARRQFARQQFSRTLFYAAAARFQKHVTILPGVVFNTESRGASLARFATEELSWRVEHAATMDLTVAIEPHLGSITDTAAERCSGTGSFTCAAATVSRLIMRILPALVFRRIHGIEPLTARATHVHARCARKRRLQSNLTENTIDFGRALRALTTAIVSMAGSRWNTCGLIGRHWAMEVDVPLRNHPLERRTFNCEHKENWPPTIGSKTMKKIGINSRLLSPGARPASDWPSPKNFMPLASSCPALRHLIRRNLTRPARRLAKMPGQFAWTLQRLKSG